jgi:NAD(P)-dependent dehydrogenase (short-subunit alcohol dehydrogenase family)
MGAVLVTGASKGIGRATALHLDLLGHTVLAAVRRQVDGDELLAASTGRVVPVLLDVTDADAIERAAQAAAEVAPEGLAGLVNNAGLVIAGPLEFLPIDELRHQLEVNVIGQVAVTRAVLPLIRRAGGRVVNVGSIGGRVAAPFTGAYNASKFALRALTDSLRLELRPWDIEVVLVEPGAVATPIWSTAVAAGIQRRQRMGPELEALYGPALDALTARALARARTGQPPERVAEVIVTALTTVRPRPRYLVGWDARVAAVIERLPDRLRERVVARRAEQHPPAPEPAPEPDPEPAAAGTSGSPQP